MSLSRNKKIESSYTDTNQTKSGLYGAGVMKPKRIDDDGSSSESDEDCITENGVGNNDDMDSSSSEEDCMEPIKRPKTEPRPSDSNHSDSDYSKVTVPASPASSSYSGSDSDSDDSRDGSSSPETPDGQYEVEKILNFVRDDFGEMYLVKWKDWAEEFNTWEPITNLLNCDSELIRFYLHRREEIRNALKNSEHVELPNGKRRRKGPKLPDMPPDPRPFDVRVEEFFQIAGHVEVNHIETVCERWRKGKINQKSRWPVSKIEKLLERGIEEKLPKSDVEALKEELIMIELESKVKNMSSDMKTWEKKINSITGGQPYITVENDVDMAGLPLDFEFVNNYVPGEGIVIPNDPPLGCACKSSCYDERNGGCCAVQSDCKFAYTRFKKINVLQGSPIYECNSKCQCGPDCPNRVVQDGKSDHKFSIFRTANGCGWGVKTLKSIKRGSFVTLYVGEVINSEEANKRGKQYDEGGLTYLFDLDFNDPESYPYSVDATKFGNVAHFINHSCSPNLAVYAVWVDCLDPNLPKLAMFALRDIPKNEELTFDYDVQLTPDTKKKQDDEDSEDEGPARNRTLCLCGTPKCRKYIL